MENYDRIKYPPYGEYLTVRADLKGIEEDEKLVNFRGILIPAWLAHWLSDTNFACKESGYLLSLINSLDSATKQIFGEFTENMECVIFRQYFILPAELKKIPEGINQIIEPLFKLINRIILESNQILTNYQVDPDSKIRRFRTKF